MKSYSIVEIDVEQGSYEWLIERAGVPTASNFKKILTSTGKRSAQSKEYVYDLVAGCLVDDIDVSPQSYAMVRGIELEPAAKSHYEIATGLKVKDCGFFKIDLEESCTIGCSPDGFIGKEGLLEIKCPMSTNHAKYLSKGVIPSEYFVQVQGQLLVTGRIWCDFVSYNPSFKEEYQMMIVRVIRDQEYINKLVEACVDLCKLKNDILNSIKGVESNEY